MNHKRKRPKNPRAGCLLCKPHKGDGMKGRSSFQALGELRSPDSAVLQLGELGRAQIRSVLTHADHDRRSIEATP